MEKARNILVVNGDDFGLSAGTNLAIQSAFRNGILSSASLMANGQAFQDAVQIARENPGLGVGVHLSLVDEHPVAPAGELGRLVGDSGFLPHSYRAFVAALLLRRFTVEHVRAEVNAQIERVLNASVTPTHVDSHQHLHVLPQVLTAVMDSAKNAGIKVVRLPLEREGNRRELGPSRRVQLALLRLLCRSAEKRLAGGGFMFADSFRGLSVSGNLTESHLRDIIDSLQPGVNELMCHPGYSDDAMAARYRWGYNWDEEAAALCSESIIRRIKEHGIQLASFRDAWL